MGNSKKEDKKNSDKYEFCKKFRNMFKKVRQSVATFLKWLLLVKEDGKNSFVKCKWIQKNGNIVRILLLLLSVGIVGYNFEWLKKTFEPLKIFDIFRQYCLIFLPISFMLFRIYWDWIKGIWKFLQTDPIIRYLFMIIIPVLIITISYNKWFYNDWFYNGWSILVVKDYPPKDIDIVDRLNGFYASLFTAITVIAGIAGLASWRTIKELKDKLEKFKEIEGKVDFLYKKKKFAEWAKDKLGKLDYSLSLPKIQFSDEDEKNLKDIEKFVKDDSLELNWVELIAAKRFVDNKDFKGAYMVYSHLKTRNLFLSEQNEENIKSSLYHYLGQLFWDYYVNEKEKSGKEWKDFKDCEIEPLNAGEKKVKPTCILTKSKDYYEKSLIIAKGTEHGAYPVLGNLALVLIELAKIGHKEKDTYLKKALEYLEEIIKLKKHTFSIYWDKARALYYKGEHADLKNILNDAASSIIKIADRKFFLEGLKTELEETKDYFPRSFHCRKKFIKELEEKLDKKCLK